MQKIACLAVAVALLYVVGCQQAKESSTVIELKGHTSLVRSVAFSPDGMKVVTASNDGTVRIWDAQLGKELKQVSGVFCAAFSSDGKKIATAGHNLDAHIWDVESGKNLQTLEGERKTPTSSVAFSLDGTKVAMADLEDEGAVQIWDTESGKKLPGLEGNTGRAMSVAFSPDGQKIATGGARPRIWDAESGKELHKLVGHTGQVHSVVFSPDGKKLVTASDDSDSTIRIWDVERGEELQKLSMLSEGQRFVDIVFPAIFLPDGKSIVTGGVDNPIWNVQVFEVESGMKLKELVKREGDDKEYYNAVYGAFSSDGKKVAIASGSKVVCIWTLE